MNRTAKLAVAIVGLMLAACGTTGAIRTETVEVKVPVAVQPIKRADVPLAPPPLPPRPKTLRQQADVLLSKWCEAVAYIVKADPLLHISAGDHPIDLPPFPECEGAKTDGR